MYTFQDSSNQSITLRPEATASVVRAFIENGLDKEPSITKWYYIGPMFRYERPQKGRFRQFSQFGIEVLGTENPAIDAEVIELLVEYIKSVGITDYELQLNSVGCSICRPRYVEVLRSILRPQKDQMCADCQERIEKNPLRVLDCKVEADQPIIDALPPIDEYLCPECSSHFSAVQDFLKLSAVTYVRNKRLVRGLDYYTKTTFEVVVGGLGSQNSVAGGGRYDGLAEELGGNATKAIGFALGLDRLVLAAPDSSREQTDIQIYITAMNDAAFRYAYGKVQSALRRAGISSEIDYQRRSLKAAMRQADKRKVPYVAIIGDEEMKENRLTLRNMRTGEQEKLTMEQVVEKIR
jgi:histidyl-tRNA synthetase